MPTDPSEERSARTERVWSQARAVLGAGLWSVTQGAHRYPDGLFPLMAESGEGCRLTDTNGREYIDWLMGWGTSVLGYRNAEVERAVIEQLRASGPLLSLLHPLEVETARRVRELVPCAERVAFGKNGSDVLGIAVRVARAATGREGILVCGYHGFHDWYMALVPQCEGIPHGVRPLIRSFRFNDLGEVRALFAEHADAIAAVVLEPMAAQLPAPGFLEGLRKLTLDHEALLVFDEVMTAFRVDLGGAQGVTGVTPDLACLGKAMGNGMALSALVGTREVMEIIARVGYGLTFRGELLALAAARKTLEVLERDDVPTRLGAVGEELRAGFLDSCRRHGVPGELIGPPARMQMSFSSANGITPLGLQTLLVQECLKRDVFTNGAFFPSAAHDERALATTLGVLDEGLEVLARGGHAVRPLLPRDGRGPDRLRGSRTGRARRSRESGGLVLKDGLIDYDPRTGRMNSTPRQVFLEVSSRCNLTCVHCPTDFGRDDGHPKLDLPLELIDKLAPWLRAASFVNLNFIGEPMLSPHFGELLRRCGEGPAQVSFNTNGLLLTPRNCATILETGVHGVGVSIDGTHSMPAIRGVTYEAVRDRIVTLARAKQERGSELPHLSLAYVLMRRNAYELPKLLRDILPRVHFHAVHVQPLIVIYETLRDENVYRDEFAADAVAEAREVAEAHGTEFIVFRSTSDEDERNADGDRRAARLGQASPTFGCVDPFYEIKIRSTGDIMACSYGRQVPVRVQDLPLDEIWNHPWYRDLRRDLYAKRFRDKCERCPFVFGCADNQEDSLVPGRHHSREERFFRGGYRRRQPPRTADPVPFTGRSALGEPDPDLGAGTGAGAPRDHGGENGRAERI